jgi:DNA invertase Pin-like site-specific DNA recombinase
VHPPESPRKRIIGYARVSKYDQDLSLQMDALKKGGCRRDQIFVDKVSGARSQRPGLEACLKALKAGDVLLVWRLDRLGRSMTHLVHLIEQLQDVVWASVPSATGPSTPRRPPAS